MYSLTQEVVKGVNIVTAMRGYPNMPTVPDLFKELDYFTECVMDSERFYGVGFRRSGSEEEIKRPLDQFDVISDTKGHLEEFYFKCSPVLIFGFRPRAFYRLVVEPLLDSMAHMTHDEILDSIAAAVEQIKDQMLINEHQDKLDAAAAYQMYHQMTVHKQQEKKIKEATAGVMKLRRKSLALAKEIAKGKQQ